MHHLGKEEGKEGGREGRGRKEGGGKGEGGEGTMKEERKKKKETTGSLPRTKGTEEVLNVVCCHLLWKCHQEHMLPRYWSCEGDEGMRGCEGGKGVETA